MMDQKGLNMFMVFLREKLETLVYADVSITEEIYEDSSAIRITIRPEENSMQRFDHRISRYEVEYSCDCFGMERYADLFSEKILGEYTNSILDSFIKGNKVSIKTCIIH